MRAAVAIAIVLGGLSLLAFVLSGIAVWQGGTDRATLGAYLSIAFVVVLTLAAAAFGLFSAKLLRPLAQLKVDLAMRAQTRVDRPIEAGQGHWLGGLPAAAEALREALHTARNETQSVVGTATRRAEEQKSRLEAILLDLSEGVIVCNSDHRILLYNQAAMRILAAPDALGLDRSLFALLTPEPILHTLELLQAERGGAETDGSSPAGRGPAGDEMTRRPVCGTIDREALLQARLSLVREAAGAVSGYVLTFADGGAELESLAQREKLLREVTQEWRRPLASLTAAAEMLADHQSLSAGERTQLETVVGKEVHAINQRFGELTRRYDRLAAGAWPLADIHSVDLFHVVSRHLAATDGLVVTPVGVPVWVYADSHSLMLALEYVIRAIAAHTGKRHFDLGVVPGRTHGYVEVTWDGDPIPATAVEAWLAEPLAGTVGNRTLREIIERHASELWSQLMPEGRACLRLPLRAAEHAVRPALSGERSEQRVPPWSEFYDFDLFRGSGETLNDTPLRKLTFVVFDSEATGLRPNEGDELVSIGAVRVVNGRILTGESFERLINPGRTIPAVTTRIHGITDDMVRDKPLTPAVVAQFKGFVGDAVLVAYNAAFDMAFLQRGAKAAGISFDNPVLDALLLSVYLQDDISDFSLTAAAARMGVEVVGRHTALGDALLTAAIFVKLLDLLEARAITTFGQALRISKWMMDQRRQQVDLR